MTALTLLKQIKKWEYVRNNSIDNGKRSEAPRLVGRNGVTAALRAGGGGLTSNRVVAAPERHTDQVSGFLPLAPRVNTRGIDGRDRLAEPTVLPKGVSEAALDVATPTLVHSRFLCEAVPKVPKASQTPFWHFWHPVG